MLRGAVAACLDPMVPGNSAPAAGCHNVFHFRLKQNWENRMKRFTAPIAGLALAALVAAPAVLAEQMQVAEVNEQRKSLQGDEVTVTGEVTKVNNGIMGRNFIHVRDGSAEGKAGHLTITSQDTARVGQEVSATGTIKLDTDFGMGYFYPTLLVEAQVAPQ